MGEKQKSMEDLQAALRAKQREQLEEKHLKQLEAKTFLKPFGAQVAKWKDEKMVDRLQDQKDKQDRAEQFAAKANQKLILDKIHRARRALTNHERQEQEKERRRVEAETRLDACICRSRRAGPSQTVASGTK